MKITKNISLLMTISLIMGFSILAKNTLKVDAMLEPVDIGLRHWAIRYKFSSYHIGLNKFYLIYDIKPSLEIRAKIAELFYEFIIEGAQ